MQLKTLFLYLLLLIYTVPVLAQNLLPTPTPDTLKHDVVVLNTAPISDIDIPMRMNLHPVYQWANQYVDTLYTSPNYPADWVMDGCETRYQYRFVRGPLHFKAFNNQLYVTFSGYYGVRGSTRLCTGIGNSAWTPACSCGFGSEKPRRIDAGFVLSFKLLPDYRLGVQVQQTEPVAVDKCTVCFFGKNITKTISDQVKAALNESFDYLQIQMQTFSLKPYVQMVWDSLQAPYRLPGFGYLKVAPQQLRISQVKLLRDSLWLSLGLSARPELTAVPSSVKKPLPNISDFSTRSGFKIFVSQQLPYDSLSGVANQQIAGREFQIGKGILKKTIRIDSVRLMGGLRGILLKVHVSKAARGVFYLEGKPVWNGATQQFKLDSLDFHFDTKQMLLRSASQLLDGTINEKLAQYTQFNLYDRIKSLNQAIYQQMNRNLYPGVNSKGYLTLIKIESLKASELGLYISAVASGKLWIEVDAAPLLGGFLK